MAETQEVQQAAEVEAKPAKAPRKPKLPKRVAAKAGTHLSPVEKAEAIALWESGEVTFADLTAKFGRNRLTFHKLFKKEGIVQGSKRKEAEARVKAAVEEETANNVAVYLARVKETKEDHYKANAFIAKVTQAEIIRCRAEKVPFSTALNSLKALKTAAEIMKTTREERYAVLGITATDAGEDKPLPDLIVQELTQKDIEEMSKSNRVGFEDGEFDLDDMGDESLMSSEDDKVEEE